MKTYGNSARQAISGKGAYTHLPAPQPVNSTSQDDAGIEYSTIDGEMITSTDGTDAVSKGKGLFIGDYFVGILDCFASISNKPYLRY